MSRPGTRQEFFITFGQAHRHEITFGGGNVLIFDSKCVAVVKAHSIHEAEDKARKHFRQQWCMVYRTMKPTTMEDYYPRGFIEVPRGG